MDLVTVLAVAAITACAPVDIERAYREATAIFVGRVVSTEPVRTGPRAEQVGTVAKLRVERAWKGPRSPVIEVTTCGNETASVICTTGAKYRAGTSFLVLAYGDAYDTSGCNTRPLDESVDELLWLASKPSHRIDDH